MLSPRSFIAGPEELRRGRPRVGLVPHLVRVAACLALGFAASASADLLYAHGKSDSTLYEIDLVAETVTAVGTDPRSGPEIELSPDGSEILFSTKFAEILSIDPTTGLTTSSLALSGFPPGTDVLTALEFDGSTLYGAAHESGVEENPGVLVTIDLGSGVLTSVGEMTGMNRPSGGMDLLGGTMYAVTSTLNSDSSLFSIDLATGAATLIAPLTIDGFEADVVSGLAGAGGTLYALQSGGDTELYSVDLATGEMILVFDLEIAMNALTVPEPGRLVLLMSGVLALLVLRIRPWRS